MMALLRFIGGEGGGGMSFRCSMQWLDDTFMWPGGTLFVCAKLATVSLNVYVHAGKAYRDIPED